MPEHRLAQLLVPQAWQIALLTVVVAIAVKLLAAKRPRMVHLLWLIVVDCGGQVRDATGVESLVRRVQSTSADFDLRKSCGSRFFDCPAFD